MKSNCQGVLCIYNGVYIHIMVYANNKMYKKYTKLHKCPHCKYLGINISALPSTKCNSEVNLAEDIKPLVTE